MLPTSETTLTAPNLVRTADGVDLFCRDWGEGRPLLFLSGWALNSLMWAFQMEPLVREGFRCIAYDRRGHGRSGDPGRGYDFDTLADDLASVIEALDLSDVVIVAHSFASGEVVRYLSRHGASRIAGVIMLAPAAIPFLAKTVDNPAGIDCEIGAAVQAEMTEDFPAWMERQSDPYFAGQASRVLADATIAMMNQTSQQALMVLAGIQMTTDFRAELAGLDLPVLFIHGDRDASAPLELTSRPACDLVKGARLIVYDGAPHGIYFTHKARLNADIVGFAADLEKMR